MRRGILQINKQKGTHPFGIKTPDPNTSFVVGGGLKDKRSYRQCQAWEEMQDEGLEANAVWSLAATTRQSIYTTETSLETVESLKYILILILCIFNWRSVVLAAINRFSHGPTGLGCE